MLWLFSIFILVSHDIFAFIYVLKILWYYQENNIPNIYRDILSQDFLNISDFFDNAGLVCVISLCCEVMECSCAWEEWFWSFFDFRSGAVDFLNYIFPVGGLKNNCFRTQTQRYYTMCWKYLDSAHEETLTTFPMFVCCVKIQMTSRSSVQRPCWPRAQISSGILAHYSYVPNQVL